MNNLYFGDSLEILKELKENHPDGFIDLAYIDPSFNKNRKFNVLFETVDLKDSNFLCLLETGPFKKVEKAEKNGKESKGLFD